MRETETMVNENGTMRVLMDAQMSKMSPEQRVALASLNEEAKKRLAEIVAFDAAKEEDVEVRATEEQAELRSTVEVETPFKEAYGKDIAVPEAVSEKCLPDPLAPGIERAHKQGGPDGSQFKKAVEMMVGKLQTTNYLRYTQATLADEFARIFKEEIMALRNAGQKEYAHDDSSPFANFERGAKDMGIDRKQVLWVYAMKHKDGIAAHLKGQISQREDVRGRVNDLIVYLLLLRGILNEEAGNTGNFGLGDKA